MLAGGAVLILLSILATVGQTLLAPSTVAVGPYPEPTLALSQDTSGSAARTARGIISLKVDEELRVIPRPRFIGVVEDRAAIVPPRNVLFGLKDWPTQTNYLGFYTPASLTSYWSDSEVIDPASGDIYRVWIDNAYNYSTLYYGLSSDGGQTLNEAVPISRMIDQIFNPTLTMDTQGHFYVLWSSRYSGDIHLYLAHSTDGGQTWSKSVRINREIRRKFNPSLAIDTSGQLYVAWQNVGGPSKGIYLSRSVDSGQTWSKEMRMAVN